MKTIKWDRILEARSIEWIPESERHGPVWSLFSVWFAANMQITDAVAGGLANVLGLSLPWAIIAIIAGNLLGATVMALHSAQGPKLGIPQMIQSRAQFGFFGAVIPVALVFLMYIGFFAASSVLGGQALSAWTGLPMVPSIIVMNLVCTIAAIFGYHVIHRAERVTSLISAAGFLYLSVVLLHSYVPGSRILSVGTFSGGTFLLAIAISATWQITYAPYVADYSRYLPSGTSTAMTFIWTYAGTVIGTVWMMVFGAVVAALAVNTFSTHPVAFVVSLAPHDFAFAFFIMILLGIFAINTLNLYGAFMSAVTGVTAARKLELGPARRALFILGVVVIGTAVGVIGYRSFMAALENFILFLAYFLIPWTAINLVDFYWVRRERYDIKSILNVEGSIYGKWNWRALSAYVLGIVVEIPFMSTTFYTGPMVAKLGGADISWILGLLVAGGLYRILGYKIHRDEDAHFSGLVQPVNQDQRADEKLLTLP